MSIAVLLPTIYRPAGLERVLKSLQNTAPNAIIFTAGEYDDLPARKLAADYGAFFVPCIRRQAGPAYAWNTALLAAQDYDIYVLASDDVEFIPGWLEESLKTLERDLRGSGMVAFNDGTGKVERAGFATQYMMTRDFIIEHNGGVAACPHYPCDFVDLESSIRAQHVGKFAYAKDAHVIHLWREVDDYGYRRADSRREQARKIFERRKAENFPDDFEPILRKVEHANRT